MTILPLSLGGCARRARHPATLHCLFFRLSDLLTRVRPVCSASTLLVKDHEFEIADGHFWSDNYLPTPLTRCQRPLIVSKAILFDDPSVIARTEVMVFQTVDASLGRPVVCLQVVWRHHRF